MSLNWRVICQTRGMSTKHHRTAPAPPLLFADGCVLLGQALDGGFRAEMVAAVSRSTDFRGALLRLRAAMQSHVFRTATGEVSLDRAAPTYDRRTRQDGFHVLHDWNGKA